MEKYKVGVIGGTGMVGQRFVTLMENHPWFQLTAIAASPRSAGKTYEQAVSGRWAMKTPIPQQAKDLVVLDASADVEKIAGMVDFVFCAVDMKKEEIRALEETYAKALEKLRNLPEARYVEVLTELLLQAAPHGVGEVLFSAQDRETVGQAAVDAANGKSGGKLTLSGETAPIQGGFILKDGNVEVNCAFDTLVRLQKAETAGQVAQRLFG